MHGGLRRHKRKRFHFCSTGRERNKASGQGQGQTEEGGILLRLHCLLSLEVFFSPALSESVVG